MSDFKKTIPNAIKFVMNEKGVKQKELSEKTGIKNSMLSMILTGQRNATIDNLYLICQALEIEMSTLFIIIGE